MAPGEQKISDESTKHSSDRLMSVIFREWPATTDALFITGGHRTRVAAVTLDNMAERVFAQREDLP